VVINIKYQNKYSYTDFILASLTGGGRSVGQDPVGL